MLKHFWKRTRLFVLIILVGILGLILINQYEKQQYAQSQPQQECTGILC